MRIALFTDRHSNKEALKAILDDIKKENIDEIICLGDVLAIGPSPCECMDLIIDNNVKLILGNHDLYLVRGTSIDDEMEEDVVRDEIWTESKINSRQKEFIEKCPLFIEKNINGKKILFEHFPIIDVNEPYPFYGFDVLEDNRINEITKALNYDLVFVGHEHHAFTIDNKLYCIGSSGCRMEGNTIYTIFDTNDFSINTKTIPFDWNKFMEDLKKENYESRDIIAKHFYGVEL